MKKIIIILGIVLSFAIIGIFSVSLGNEETEENNAVEVQETSKVLTRKSYSKFFESSLKF